jgi:hypothetical protein
VANWPASFSVSWCSRKWPPWVNDGSGVQPCTEADKLQPACLKIGHERTLLARDVRPTNTPAHVSPKVPSAHPPARPAAHATTS